MEPQKRFSIVVPVYNAEKYLQQCVDSVLNQFYPVQKKVELILVNDGSRDSSAEICESYQQQYPDNIVYIYQDNAGPSAARNRGVEAATGEIIGFLDADDKYSRKTLAQVDQYFRVALDLADVAIIPVTNFGDRTFPYYLNGKFKAGTRTIDLNHPEWNDVCMRVGQAFVRSEVAKQHTFDASITFFEDSKYINDITSDKMRMGLVTNCEYFYRRYSTEADSATSLTAGAETNKRLYLETPVKVVLHFLEQYENDQDAPLYFQYLALCEMRWRTFYTQNRTFDFLTPEECKTYEDINDRILKRVSDHAILTFEQYAPWQKLYLLNRKHKKDVLEECTIDEEKQIVWNGDVLFKAADSKVLLYDVKTTEKAVELHGYVHALLTDEIACFARVNDEVIGLRFLPETISSSDLPLDYPPYGYQTFSLTIPLAQERTTVSFGLTVAGGEVAIRKVLPSKRGDITGIQNPTNYAGDCIILRRPDSLEIIWATLGNKIRYRFKSLKARAKKLCKKVIAAAKKGPMFFLRKVKNKLLRRGSSNK